MWWFRNRPNKKYDVFAIMGQSNASGRGRQGIDDETSDNRVWVFGNDYKYKIASIPVDSATNQVDTVSDDNIFPGGTYGHGFPLSASKEILDTLNKRILVLPCAKGSTAMSAWMPSADRYDRSTLFGSANYRRKEVLKKSSNQLKGIWYYGHESNSMGQRPTYATDWADLIGEIRTDFGSDTPFIYVQLAKNTVEWINESQFLTGEIQRLQETGSGDTTEMTNMFMVVAFDLPLVDDIHLDYDGQKELGRRIGLATLEHIYGEDIDGTGPRLVSVTNPSATTIKVKTTQTINTATDNYDNQFRVYDDGVEATITSVVRDTDNTAALITVSAPLIGTITVEYGNVVASGTNVTYSNVIKNSNGLPLPTFRVVI